MPAAATSSTLRVLEELRHAILDGTLAPGARLGAESLAERFGTSRAPVREALLLLGREGLVEVVPRGGAIVAPFDVDDLLELYEVRSLIEPHAAARAATRICPERLRRLGEICDEADARADDVDEQIRLDEELHAMIVSAAASPRLESALGAVAGIPRAFRTVFWAASQQRERSLTCHRELVLALGRGRPELAEAVMRTHILDARAFLLEVAHGRR